MALKLLISPVERLQEVIEKRKTLLSVQNLFVSFSVEKKELQAVRGVSFEIFEGEAVGIVGESGCGKSAMVQAITRLGGSSKVEGKVFFQGQDLLSLSEREIRKIRGKKIGNIFQDPMTSLNPTMKIGAQIQETLLYHKMASRKEAFERSLELLELIQVPDPLLRMNQYPHQLSGGMRQRILIAIALIAHPDLIIADEPTTALDVTVQAQILDLLKRMQSYFRMSLLLITHDLGVVAETCDRILVIYAGKIIEMGPTQKILKEPKHPYTQMLIESLPLLDRPKGTPLKAISGTPPSLINPPKGCAFQERCPFRMDVCKNDPPFFESAACFRGAL